MSIKTVAAVGAAMFTLMTAPAALAAITVIDFEDKPVGFRYADADMVGPFYSSPGFRVGDWGGSHAGEIYSVDLLGKADWISIQLSTWLEDTPSVTLSDANHSETFTFATDDDVDDFQTFFFPLLAWTPTAATIRGGGGVVFVDNITVDFIAPVIPPAPVPEPATWAMMLAGFSLAGATIRRRGMRSTC